MFEFCLTSAMAMGVRLLPRFLPLLRELRGATIELSFRRAEGQFSYVVGACKEAVLPQKVGGQRPVHECFAR